MKWLIQTTVAVLCITALSSQTYFSSNTVQHNKIQPTPTNTPKIQAAILLDVSGSMSGLIDQAKAQLWNMVSTMGKAQCNGQTPKIEIALYEYGRPDHNVTTGYVKQISPFTSDLDKLSQDLFSLNTNGGDEYCGRVILTSLQELNWDTAASNYKVIFIAGNEDFLQGPIHFTQSCQMARDKSVIVNTIYCGNREQGIKEHWNLSGECGNGSFTNIDHNAKIEDVPTPYDSLILTYNQQLNATYISYGASGSAALMAQNKVDKMNYSMSKTAAVKRASVKGKKELYKNNHWDAIDASEADEKFLDKLDKKTLADTLQNKSTTELKIFIAQKKAERTNIQQEIGKLSIQRELYIASEKSKAAGNKQTTTLETEIEKIIKQQAKRFQMIIE